MERKIAKSAPATCPVSLIYNGVDLVRYDHTDPCCTLREEYGMPADAQIVASSPPEHEKGHPTLLRCVAAGAAPRAQRLVLVVGEGSRREELEAQARPRIMERVVFTPVAATTSPR